MAFGHEQYLCEEPVLSQLQPGQNNRRWTDSQTDEKPQFL